MFRLDLFRLLKPGGPALSLASSPNNISKLPDELLIIIFYHVISSFRPPEDRFPLHAQTLLSRISRRWYGVISSTPSLWTHVPIAPYQSIHTLQKFLHSSSSLPISVTIYPWPALPTHDAVRSLNAQLHTLLRAKGDRERITSLRIEATRLDDLVDRVAQTWQEACAGRPARSLKCLSLKGARHSVWQGSQFFDSDVAPALRTLVVEDMPLGWFEGPSRCGSWHNMTTLVWRHSPGFDQVSVLEFSQLVSAFAGVTTLVLDGFVVNFDVATQYGAGLSCLGTPVESVESVKSVYITDEAETSTCLTVLFQLFPCMTHLFIGPCSPPSSVTRMIPVSQKKLDGCCVVPRARMVDHDVCVYENSVGDSLAV